MTSPSSWQETLFRSSVLTSWRANRRGNYLQGVLSFRLLGIPVGVHLTFLFVALLGPRGGGWVDVAIWTVAAFVSILVHEMGHALTARTFEAQGVNVTLYGLGGVTSYSHGRGGMTHGKSFVVSAAGSFFGIILGGAVWLLANNGMFDGASHEVQLFIDSIVFTALLWGVLNWIPIVPLDGGHMVESLAATFNEDKAPLIGQVITWIAVAIVVPLALISGYRFGAIIVVLFAISGVREYRKKTEALAARDRARKQAEGIIVPDEVRPVPPADPTPPSRPTPPRRDESHQDPPEFPI